MCESRVYEICEAYLRVLLLKNAGISRNSYVSYGHTHQSLKEKKIYVFTLRCIWHTMRLRIYDR